MTRLSVGLLSSASYLPCPFRKDPRTLKRGSLGTGGRRVATKPTPSPSASSNWAVVYRSFLPFHFFLSLFLFFAYPPPFSLASFISLSLSLSSSISPRQRSISDAYYQRYSSPNPFSTNSCSLFFSLFLSLVFVFISPSTFSPLLERIPSFVDTRASFRQPPRFDTSIGLWGNVATWFVVVTAIVGDRAVPSCRHFCFLEYLWKKYSLEILKRGWRRVNVSSLFLSLFLSRVRDNEWSDELMIYREGISHILGDCSRMTWHRFELLCL